MKLLLENWREYVKQEVESFLPHGTVRDINMIGSSTLSPEEQDRQDMEKHGHVQAERDIDIEVQIADITREEAEEWAFSDEAERLEIENNYDVQLTIVENWREYLAENQEESGLLYHATLSGENNSIVRSFIDNGIDPTRAGGFGQGGGFYLWTDIKDAHHYIKGLVHGMSGGSKEEEVSGEPIIIVVDEPVTPQNFDIDYELFAKGLVSFIEKNLDYFKQNGAQLGISTRMLDRGLQIDQKVLGTGSKRSTIAKWDSRSSWEGDIHGEDYRISLADGEDLGALAAKLHELDPAKYEEFEAESLPDARALKYNGTEKIWPLRIEDAEGNVLWSRE